MISTFAALSLGMSFSSTLSGADEEKLTGWRTERELFNKIVASLPAKQSTVRTYRRSPKELWVYDARPELGIGVCGGIAEQLGMIRKLGIRFVRKTMYWYHIENTEERGVYDPEALANWDGFTKMAKEKGLELLVVVHGNAPGTGWANRHESYQRFAKFMADMSKRYPSVRYWELWNEMDVAFTDLFGKDDPKLKGFGGGKCYAEMLKIAYPAIKSANPDAWVVMGGLASWSDFPRGVYENGGRNFFDIMNLHTYGVPVKWPFLGRGHQLRELMCKYDDEAKPFWNTEFGIDAGSVINAWGFPHKQGKRDGEVFDQKHLEAWKNCVNIARKSGLYQKYMPYQFHAGNEMGPKELRVQSYADKHLPPNLTIDDYGFGLVRRDGITPRPTYEWLLDEKPNREIVRQPTRVVDVSVPFTGYVPAGYAFKVNGNTLIIKDVKIDSLQPTKVRLHRKDNYYILRTTSLISQIFTD